MLGGAVLFWVAGFDLFYSLYDLDHDRREGLHSWAVRFGERGVFAGARTFHAVTVGLLALTGGLALMLNFAAVNAADKEPEVKPLSFGHIEIRGSYAEGAGAPGVSDVGARDAAHTGAPGEANCTACHSDFQVNRGPGNVSITGVPANYLPNQNHSITVTTTQSDAVIFGFQLTAIDSTGATASRLVVGTRPVHHDLESALRSG